MPLDSRKSTHLAAVVPKTWAARQKTVTLVSGPPGAQTYATALVILRPLQTPDPTVADAGGQPPRQIADTLMIAPLTLSLVGVVLVADTATATAGGVAAARKYELVDVSLAGILPGGTHQHILLRRLR
jgi:hypothetical protein